MAENLLSSPKSFIFEPVSKGRNVIVLLGAFCSVVLFCAAVFSQTRPAVTLFFDSDGIQISNDEFVDIRMANFHYPDRTIVRTLEDGTVEFRLQKIPQEGMRAPDFTVRTLDGRTLSMAELRGKVVVLNFWFIGCPVCYSMKPKLNELRAKFASRGDVVFLAMTADTTTDVKRYLAKEKFDYIQAADAKAPMNMFVFSGFPKNIVVNRTGEIVYWRSSVTAMSKFETVIRNELER